MFETAQELEQSWRLVASRHQRGSRVAAPKNIGGERERWMRSELLTLLCPDWRNAMLVVDPHSLAVAYANLHALDMFKRRLPVYVSGGILEVAIAGGARQLRGTLDRAMANSIADASVVLDDEERNYACAVRVRTPQGFLREVLERHLEAPGRLVVLEITTGRMMLARRDLEALAAAYELTSAELRVLQLLVEGRSLSEIAVLRSVQLGTVRNQCKHLLSKTRCRRQSDLVRFVLALCAQDAQALHG